MEKRRRCTIAGITVHRVIFFSLPSKKNIISVHQTFKGDSKDGCIVWKIRMLFFTSYRSHLPNNNHNNHNNLMCLPWCADLHGFTHNTCITLLLKSEWKKDEIKLINYFRSIWTQSLLRIGLNEAKWTSPCSGFVMTLFRVLSATDFPEKNILIREEGNITDL